MCDLEAVFCSYTWVCGVYVLLNLLLFVWSCVLCLLDMHSKHLLGSSMITLIDHYFPVRNQMFCHVDDNFDISMTVSVWSIKFFSDYFLTHVRLRIDRSHIYWLSNLIC